MKTEQTKEKHPQLSHVYMRFPLSLPVTASTKQLVNILPSGYLT